jgi:hypothetical protein
MDCRSQRNTCQILQKKYTNYFYGLQIEIYTKLFINLRTNYKLLEVLLEYAGVLVCIR